MNYYPDLPIVPYARTTVDMRMVIAYLAGLSLDVEVMRATYVIFRIESGNGQDGVNNNYAGVQADSGKWEVPAGIENNFIGVVDEDENGTKRERLFLAFALWSTSVDFLANRVLERGLYVGGTTHQVSVLQVKDDIDLARAYYREWVTGEANAEPPSSVVDTVTSIYEQAKGLFGNG